MLNLSVQELTGFFLKCEVSASAIECGNERASQLWGLIDRTVTHLSSGSVAAARQRRKRKAMIEQSSSPADFMKAPSSPADAATCCTSPTTLMTSPVRVFSLHGIWSSAQSALRVGADAAEGGTLTTSRRTRHAKAIALLLGEPVMNSSSSSSSSEDEDEESAQKNKNNKNDAYDPRDPVDLFATSGQQQFYQLRQRAFEYRVAALREAISCFLDICSISAVQSAALPLLVPPLHFDSTALRPTAVAMTAFRPAVLLTALFAPAAIEVAAQKRKQQKQRDDVDEENAEDAQGSSSNSFASVVDEHVLTNHVDVIISEICQILTDALATSAGFIGPALLSIWWRFFVRRVDGAGMLAALEQLEERLGWRGSKAVLADSAMLLRKCYPEVSVIKALALLLVLDEEDKKKNKSNNNSEKEDADAASFQLHQAAALCNQALSHSRELRECATGWVASRGSRCCALTLLVRSEVQRRLLRHSSALDDTKDAVDVDEGAKVFSGEAICAGNAKVVHSMVTEFAAALFPSFGTDASHAALFGENGEFGSDPFAMAHRSLVAAGNNNNSGFVVKDLATMLVAIHREACTPSSSASPFSSSASSQQQRCCFFNSTSASRVAAIHRHTIEALPVPPQCQPHVAPHYSAAGSNRLEIALQQARQHYDVASEENDRLEMVHHHHHHHQQQQKQQSLLAAAQFFTIPTVSDRVVWLLSLPASTGVSNSNSRCISSVFWLGIPCAATLPKIAGAAPSTTATKRRTPVPPPASSNAGSRRSSVSSVATAPLASSTDKNNRRASSRNCSVAAAGGGVRRPGSAGTKRSGSSSSSKAESATAAAPPKRSLSSIGFVKKMETEPVKGLSRRTSFSEFCRQYREEEQQQEQQQDEPKKKPADSLPPLAAMREDDDEKPQQQQPPARKFSLPQPPKRALTPQLTPQQLHEKAIAERRKSRTAIPQSTPMRSNNNNAAAASSSSPSGGVAQQQHLQQRRDTNVKQQQLPPTAKQQRPSPAPLPRSTGDSSKPVLPKKEDLVKSFFARAAAGKKEKEQQQAGK